MVYLFFSNCFHTLLQITSLPWADGRHPVRSLQPDRLTAVSGGCLNISGLSAEFQSLLNLNPIFHWPALSFHHLFSPPRTPSSFVVFTQSGCYSNKVCASSKVAESLSSEQSALHPWRRVVQTIGWGWGCLFYALNTLSENYARLSNKTKSLESFSFDQIVWPELSQNP